MHAMSKSENTEQLKDIGDDHPDRVCAIDTHIPVIQEDEERAKKKLSPRTWPLNKGPLPIGVMDKYLFRC